MTVPTGFDPATLTLAGAAILGGIVRAACGKHPTLSRRTAIDVMVSGAGGVIFPLFGVVPTKEATLLQLGALGFIIGLFGSYLLAFVAYKVGVFKDDPRAARPDGNGDSGSPGGA